MRSRISQERPISCEFPSFLLLFPMISQQPNVLIGLPLFTGAFGPDRKLIWIDHIHDEPQMLGFF